VAILAANWASRQSLLGKMLELLGYRFEGTFTASAVWMQCAPGMDSHFSITGILTACYLLFGQQRKFLAHRQSQTHSRQRSKENARERAVACK
jgi:hypothetical protein